MESTEPSEDQVIAYLHEHPQFFARQPDLLAEMYLPSPHGSGTVSLAERQQLAQRDRIRVLEAKLANLMRFGEENDATSDKVHRLSLGLLAAPNLEVLLQLLAHALREDFAVPYVGLRLWGTPHDTGHQDNQAFEPVGEDIRNWTLKLTTPYCGHQPELEFDGWFGNNATPRSYALVALRGENVFGLLAMASDDEARFYPDMGTLYLKRIGELVSAALLRYVD